MWHKSGVYVQLCDTSNVQCTESSVFYNTDGFSLFWKFIEELYV
jgi:hypothetical protein